MKQPVDHILRPQLPWRAEDTLITECGYEASKVSAIPREVYFQRLKEMGQQRCAMFTCMTCSQTASRWGTWQDDPRQTLAREIDWEGNRWQQRGDRLRDELTAIADLVEVHKGEFMESIRIIQERRAWVEKKAEAVRRPKQKPLGNL